MTSTFWTDENKNKAISMYQEAEPTPETSTEIVKEIADERSTTPNGVRMVLMQANVYLKKSDGAQTNKKTTAGGGGGKKVSKEDSIAALREAISAKGKEVDEDIIGKLTGKAAVYLLSVIS